MTEEEKKIMNDINSCKLYMDLHNVKCLLYFPGQLNFVLGELEYVECPILASQDSTYIIYKYAYRVEDVINSMLQRCKIFSKVLISSTEKHYKRRDSFIFSGTKRNQDFDICMDFLYFNDRIAQVNEEIKIIKKFIGVKNV